MGKINEIEEIAIEKEPDMQAQFVIISKEIDSDLAAQLQKIDNHESRMELLLLAILKELKKT